MTNELPDNLSARDRLREINRLTSDIATLHKELDEGASRVGLTVYGKYIEDRLSFDERLRLVEIVVRFYAQTIDLKISHLKSLGVTLEWPGVDAFVTEFMGQHEPEDLFRRSR